MCWKVQHHTIVVFGVGCKGKGQVHQGTHGEGRVKYSVSFFLFPKCYNG